LKRGSAGLVLFGLLASPVFAQTPNRLERHVREGVPELESALSVAENRIPGGPSFNYEVFTHELIAWILKEALPDAGDEYGTQARIPSSLSRGDPWPRSQFGAHCLTVLGQIGSQVLPLAEVSSPPLRARRSPLLMPYQSLAGAALMVADRVWPPLRSHIEDKRSGFSLDPKVSSHKFGLSLTYRW
jgi:hypothetical protein